MENRNDISEKKIIRLIAFGVLLYAAAMNLGAVGDGFSYIMGIASPVVLGLAIALVLNVPLRGFERLFALVDKKGRLSAKARNNLSLLLSVICVPLVLFLVLDFVVPQFLNAITNVIAIVRQNEAVIAEFVGEIGISSEFVKAKLDELVAWVTSNVDVIAGSVLTTVFSTASSVMDIVLSLILAIYVLLDKVALKERMKRLVRAFLPEKYARGALQVGSLFPDTFSTFLGYQCLEAVILGVILLLCMMIFGIPYSVTVACVTALLALIPYVGAYISMAVGVVLVVTVSPMKALIFVVVFLVAQQIEGNLIYPRVVGKSVGLPAYITLAAVMVGGAIAGIVGMFFVIPVVSVIYVLVREEVQRRMPDGKMQAKE